MDGQILFIGILPVSFLTDSITRIPVKQYKICKKPIGFIFLHKE